MRKVRMFLVALGVAVWSLPAAPAGAVICHDQPGMCCDDPVILGKPVDLPIDC